MTLFYSLWRRVSRIPECCATSASWPPNLSLYVSIPRKYPMQGPKSCGCDFVYLGLLCGCAMWRLLGLILVKEDIRLGLLFATTDKLLTALYPTTRCTHRISSWLEKYWYFSRRWNRNIIELLATANPPFVTRITSSTGRNPELSQVDPSCWTSNNDVHHIANGS